jgi:hypothetical protein
VWPALVDDGIKQGILQESARNVPFDPQKASELQAQARAMLGGQTNFGDPYAGPRGSLLQRGPNGEVRPIVGAAAQTGGPDAPSGYRYKPDGTLEPVLGGPADPSGPGARRASMQLRKEYEDQEPVKQYRIVLPLFQRASTAPDNRAGDISVIYALGKMFDPTSVVREGELQLAQTAAPWLQQMAASINSQITGEGRLNPQTRATIMQALNGQVEALRMPYEQERQRYGQYAEDSGFESGTVVGPDPAEAFANPPQQLPNTNAKGWTLHTDAQGNKAYVSPDGKQFEEAR